MGFYCAQVWKPVPGLAVTAPDWADALTKYLYLQNREVNAGKQSTVAPTGKICET